VGAFTKIVQVQNKFALKFKDVMFLDELAMFGETNTMEIYGGDFLSFILSEPFTFDNVIQIIKTQHACMCVHKTKMFIIMNNFCLNIKIQPTEVLK
jgi:hypothetical protein